MGTKQTREGKQPKQNTPTFLLELSLEVDEGQAKRLRAHLEVARLFYNAALSGATRSPETANRGGWATG
jgi:hypothetical protein